MIIIKIAIACEGEYVSGHFGHCEGYKSYEVKEGRIMKKDFIQNPGHRPGFLPDYLNELGVKVVISGGMGEAAQQLFDEQNIKVIVGAKGYCDDILQQYLNNELESTGEICR